MPRLHCSERYSEPGTSCSTIVPYPPLTVLFKCTGAKCLPSVLAITGTGDAVCGMYSNPAGTGSTCLRSLIGLASGFLHSTTYSITSPGRTLSADCLCSTPLATTILFCDRTIFGPACCARRGMSNASVPVKTSADRVFVMCMNTSPFTAAFYDLKTCERVKTVASGLKYLQNVFV